jgi:hypothetical protein
MSATAAAPSAAAAPAPPAETPSDGGGRGGGVRRARRPRATSGKIWTASETVCAFYAGSRASLFKQQNELANLCELTNNAYQERANELSALGDWKGSVSVRESIEGRGALLGAKSATLWNRFKTAIATCIKDVRPLFNDICPGGQVPSGTNREDADRELTLRYYQRDDSGILSSARSTIRSNLGLPIPKKRRNFIKSSSLRGRDNQRRFQYDSSLSPWSSRLAATPSDLRGGWREIG